MFTPLIKTKDALVGNINQPLVTNSTNLTNTVGNTNTAEKANNSTTTFQDINTSSKIDNSTKQTEDLAKAISENTKNIDSGAERSEGKEAENKALSDERCKELFGNDCDLIGAIADLNEYIYKYKEGAEKIDPKATPDEVHLGPIAQELKANPVTEAAVEEDPLTGFLKVDTAQLSLTEMSILSAMAKRIEDIEKRFNEMTSKETE